jgi:hypothetical protein
MVNFNLIISAVALLSFTATTGVHAALPRLYTRIRQNDHIESSFAVEFSNGITSFLLFPYCLLIMLHILIFETDVDAQRLVKAHFKSINKNVEIRTTMKTSLVNMISFTINDNYGPYFLHPSNFFLSWPYLSFFLS